MNRLQRVGALIALLFSARAFDAHAQSCQSCIFLDCHTPAVSVPANLWGELEPGDPGVLPIARDSSHLPDYGNPEFIPRWTSVDPVEDGAGKWLFAVTNLRVQAWNLNANPDLPAAVSDLGFSQTGMEAIIDAHTATVFTTVKTAPNSSNQIVVGGVSQAGLGVFNTTNKASLALRYQDRTKDVNEVYTARLGSGRDYAFAAGALNGAGVRVYDLTSIAGLGTTCVETTPSPILCGNVYVGSVGPISLQRASGISGTGNYLAIAASSFEGPGGIFIYNVSTPSTPLQVMSGMQGTGINDVAMWQQGANYYLAVRKFNRAEIYDVSCIAGGSCALGAPIWSATMPNSASLARVTFSRSGAVPMLYWTTGLSCVNGTTGEQLQDVTSPAAPRNIAEPSYWSYYHWSSASGFNYFAPFEGRFLNDRFYRAAFSVLDVHRWDAAPVQPPAIGSVSAAPNPASVCQPVTFAANNVTNGSGANYSWQVLTSTDTLVTSGGGISQNQFVWNTSGAAPGLYKGRLVVTNSAGPSSPATSPNVTVNGLTPLPGAGTFAPVKVVDNQGAVKFDVTASGATEWSWDFGDSGGVFGSWSNDPINGKSPTHVYASTGAKTVRVQVRNCAGGPVTSANLNIDVPVVNPLVANFAFQSCAFQLPGPVCQAGSGLNFQDQSTGAQTWDYDWDCQQGGSGSTCNTFEDAGKTTPVNSHTYASGGIYTPQLRVKRNGGAETSSVFTHSAITIQGNPTPTPPPPPPPTPTPPPCGDGICTGFTESLTCPQDCSTGPTISGPNTGLPNTSYTFTASASGCTPNANGWNWTHDGSATPSTTNSITIQWATTGTKSISVTNSGCTGTGTRNVVIATGGGGQVGANFTTQINGLVVTFNAASSTGSNLSFLWNFGDGKTGSGMTIEHTYPGPGSYTVVLTATREVPTCPFYDNTCRSEKTSTIQLGGGGTPTPTPPPPSNGLCQADGDTFCALNGDFEVEVNWEKRNGETGVGRLVNGASSDNTGIFYFVDPGNWELLLKVLDGCARNGHYWVFGGAASDLKYRIRVTDLVTDDVWTFDNDLGHRSDAITDTTAFNTCNVDRNVMRANAAARRSDLAPRINPFESPTPGASATPTPTPSPTPLPDVGPCDPNTNTLCAISERFEVRVSWVKKNGETGNGVLTPTRTDNSGVFWFFAQQNWELLIKVLNGCGLNNHYWVFGAGATNVNYTVTVKDLSTGATWEYENPQGHSSAAIADTSAFDTCP